MASLGKDLAHIRNEQELSLEDIHESTKIPIYILQSIEDGTIFEEFEENATYIRSYVRSYAKALSIDEKQIIFALNKAEKDDYSGSLQSLFSEKPKRTFEYDEEESLDDGEEEPDSSEKQDDMVHDHSPEFQSHSDSSTQNTSKPSSSKSYPRTDRSNIKSIDWADMGKKFQPLKSVRSRTWIGIVIILLLATAGGTFFYFYETEPIEVESTNNTGITTQGNESTDNVSTDSLELDITPREEQQDTTEQQTSSINNEFENETLSSLPDTLNIVLYAAYGRLEPVRVYTDVMDDINPYWIEEGEAIRFNFVNEMTIRGQTSRMVLLLNGHPVPNLREEFYNPDTRLLEINRSYFEDDPQWLQPAPDSLAIDAPPPSSIIDRPTFN